MYKRILSASVSVQEGIPSPEFHFHPGINILCGQNAEAVVLTLAGIFGGIPLKPFEAALNWQDGVTIFMSGEDGRVKDFHKQCFWKVRNNAHIMNGTELPAGTSGASRLMLEKLDATLAQTDDRPLFVYNFLERLDEAVDLRPIFEALLVTGRQVFIAVPHYYESKILEGMPYDTAIHTL